MIRNIKEGDVTWFDDLLPSDIPHPLPSGISLHVRGRSLGIEVQGLVGAIPLNNGDTVQITPKIGHVNFLRLLFKAQGSLYELEKEFENFVEYSLEDEPNVNSVVIQQFILSLAKIFSSSPKQGRVKRLKQGTFLAGQIDPAATAFNLASRKSEPVVYLLKDKTVDIAENRVISEALLRAWQMLDDQSRIQYKWLRDKWLSRFPRATDLNSDLYIIEQRFAASKYGGPRDYYRRVLMLSQIILGVNGLGFGGGMGLYGDAILLNTADIFEKYLRSQIAVAYSQEGYVVCKGNAGVSSLYTDGSFELEPDIVISRHGPPILIADAKYKKPTPSDHYQINTYLSVYGLKRGLLIAPLFEGNEVLVKEYSTAQKTIVREVYLPMNNLSTAEAFLGNIVERFAT